MGGFLTIGYYLRTIGYCFPYCFLEIFVGRQGLDVGGQSHNGGNCPPVPLPPKKTLTREVQILITDNRLILF